MWKKPLRSFAVCGRKPSPHFGASGEKPSIPYQLTYMKQYIKGGLMAFGRKLAIGLYPRM